MGTSPTGAAASSLDPSFGKGGVVRTPVSGTIPYAFAVIVMPDRSIVLTGETHTSKTILVLARYRPNGALDTKFGSGGIVKTNYANGFAPSALTRQRDGKLVVAGTSFDVSNNTFPTLARYRPNGSLDSDFGAGGIVRAPSSAGRSGNAVLVQRDGKIVLGTSAQGFGLARFAGNGKSLDPTFDGDGIAGVPGDVGGCGASSQSGTSTLALTPGGALLASGICGGASTSDPQPTGGLLRYRGTTTVNNGALDANFGSGGATLAPFARPSFGQGFARLGDGRLVQADQIGYGNANARIGLFRTTPNGAIDPTFGKNGSAKFTIAGFTNSAPVGLAVAPNGSLVIPAFDGNDDGAFAVARRTPRGAPDTSFGPGGQASVRIGPPGAGGMTQSGAAALALQSDDRALVVGITYKNGQRVFTLVRFRAPVGRIRNLAITPTTLLPASSGPPIEAAATHGGLVTYVGTEPATTTFTVLHAVAGRLQGGRCVRSTQANQGHKHCTRYLAFGSFQHKDRAGSNHFHFTGRLHGRKLAPGNYRLRAVPHNSGGSGPSAVVGFRVKSG